MPLNRFGSALIRLERVIAVREIPPGPDSPPGGKVRVYFDGQRAVDFDGEDAAAIRQYRANQPPPAPSDARDRPAQAGQVLDPATGRPLRSGRGGKNVGPA